MIDQGFITQNLDQITRYGGIILVVAVVMAAASGARFYFVSVLGERVLTDLRRAVFDHLLTLDAVFFDTHRVGELTSRLNGDVATIRGAIGSSLSLVLRSMVTITGAVVLMFLTSWYLALAVVIVAPALILPVVFIGKRLSGMSRRTQDALAEMSAMATEALSSTKTIKSFGQEAEQARHLRRSCRGQFPRRGNAALCPRLADRRRDVPRHRRRSSRWCGGARRRSSKARSPPASSPSS